jgi:hypothetical protein
VTEKIYWRKIQLFCELATDSDGYMVLEAESLWWKTEALENTSSLYVHQWKIAKQQMNITADISALAVEDRLTGG